MAVTGLLGVPIERFAYRPLRNAPRLAPLITAVGVSFILQNVVQIWLGDGRPGPALDLPEHSTSSCSGASIPAELRS